MLETLKQGLIITGIGMGLVFVMIFLLWGIMALLVWLTNPREKKGKTEALEEAVLDPASLDKPTVYELTDGDGAQRLAAALAVAFALQRPKSQGVISLAPQIEQSTSWLATGRVQQLLSRNRGRN